MSIGKNKKKEIAFLLFFPIDVFCLYLLQYEWKKLFLPCLFTALCFCTLSCSSILLCLTLTINESYPLLLVAFHHDILSGNAQGAEEK